MNPAAAASAAMGRASGLPTMPVADLEALAAAPARRLAAAVAAGAAASAAQQALIDVTDLESPVPGALLKVSRLWIYHLRHQHIHRVSRHLQRRSHRPEDVAAMNTATHQEGSC